MDAQAEELVRKAFYAGVEAGRATPGWRDMSDAHVREAFAQARDRGFELTETESLANQWDPSKAA